jgi:hypothetical protein
VQPDVQPTTVGVKTTLDKDIDSNLLRRVPDHLEPEGK